ncbi:MAG: IS110 family transposase [Clostridiales bacterium]|nr:IS110 family transposase [Clostridiales bacterium]
MLKVINPVVCGLDVHKDFVKACLLKAKDSQKYEDTIRTFTTMTSDLEKLKAWLLEENCKKVVMESTGKHWIPVHNILEDSLEIVLANARHVKNLPGRKTDTNDARWLAKLLALGLVEGSFIPPKYIRELRDLTRRRQKLIHMRSSERSRLLDVMRTSNIMLSSVVSDVFGVSGMAMIEALIADNDEESIDVESIANLSQCALRKKIPQLIEALNGHLDKHQKNLTKEILDHLEFLESQIARLETMIDEKCEPYKEIIDIIDSHPGVNKTAAQAIIAEIGPDMEVFHSDDHLASWCGLSPSNNESAGKKKPARVRAGNNYVKTILCQCAHASSNAKNTYIAARYWSIKARRGPQKAAIATARKIITSIYHMVETKTYYCETGHNSYKEARDKNKARSMIKKLQTLGYEVKVKDIVV